MKESKEGKEGFMCFSAPASFTASALLTVMGAALVTRVKDKKWLPLALIPWFFAMQQASEGFVWLKGSEGVGAKNIFLFFAYVFWPIWISFSLYLAEENHVRKQLLSFCLGMGLVVGCALMIVIPHTSAVEYSNSIQYIQSVPWDMYSTLALLFYSGATLLPFFLSSIPRMWGVGLIISLAGIAVYTLNRFCFVSLWCFWAALLSMSLFFVFFMQKRTQSL